MRAAPCAHPPASVRSSRRRHRRRGGGACPAAATEVDVPALNASFAAGPRAGRRRRVRAAVHRRERRRPPGRAARLGDRRLHDARRPARRPRIRHEHWTRRASPGRTRRRTAPPSRSRARPRSAACSVGGSATARVQLRDHTSGDLTTIASDASRPPSARSSRSRSLSIPACSDRGTATACCDDEPRGGGAAEQHPRRLRRHRADGDRRAAGRRQRRTAAAGGPRRRARQAPAPAAAARTALRLLAPRPRALLARPARRAARAGDPRRHRGGPLASRCGSAQRVRRVTTGRDGSASLRLLRRDRAAAPRHVPGRRGDGLDLCCGPRAREIRDAPRRARPRGLENAFDNVLPFRRRVLLGALVAGLALVFVAGGLACTSTTTRARARPTTRARASSSPARDRRVLRRRALDAHGDRGSRRRCGRGTRARCTTTSRASSRRSEAPFVGGLGWIDGRGIERVSTNPSVGTGLDRLRSLLLQAGDRDRRAVRERGARGARHAGGTSS